MRTNPSRAGAASQQIVKDRRCHAFKGWTHSAITAQHLKFDWINKNPDMKKARSLWHPGFACRAIGAR
jgi:hypothetical protein